jgi:hypothetical protein
MADVPPDENQQRESLLNEINSRKALNLRWGDQNFVTSQVQGWITILASFGSAIAAAAKANSVAVAIIAAIPGTVILIDRNFGFARRAQWHWESYYKLLELEHELKYNGAQVSDISKRYISLRTEMSQKFPITPPDRPVESDKPKEGHKPIGPSGSYLS